MADNFLDGKKTLREKEKLLVVSNFSFSHSVFKRRVLQSRKKRGLFGKGLKGRATLLAINFWLSLVSRSLTAQPYVNKTHEKELLRAKTKPTFSSLNRSHSCSKYRSGLPCVSTCICPIIKSTSRIRHVFPRIKNAE